MGVRAIVAAMLLLLIGACGSADAAGPPEIEYGRDLCTQCGMIISDARFATSYEIDGAPKLFDDVGGMVLHMRSTGDEPTPDNVWVADFHTEEWVTAANAFFVPSPDVVSPMGHAIASFDSEDAAVAFAGEGGTVLVWAEVLALPAEGGLLGHHHGDHADDMGHDHEDESHSEAGQGDESSGHDH